ncbi:hypothetical protein RhiJN_05846 [Ceratobasidium sp. AG-Ba]|nr:hypothetical protein RhiJN_05846 [Ceratobasidium sp. AG-Ba]
MYMGGGRDTYRTNDSDTYRSGTGANKSVTTYRSNTPAYIGTGSGTYRPGSVGGCSRSVASESYNNDTYMTGTGSDTYRAGGSDAGISGFLNSMYPPASESGTRTATGSRSGSHSRSRSAYSQGMLAGGFSQERAETPTQGRSEGGFSQGSSTHGCRSTTYQASEAYTQGTATYIQGSGTYTQESDTYVPAMSAYTEDSYTQRSDTYAQGLRTESPPSPACPTPKSSTMPRATRTQRAKTPLARQSPSDRREDPFLNIMPLTPKNIGLSLTSRTQAGVMTPRTPRGRLGKALSEASTAPTSAEGLMRQRMSREIANSVPVPSESEAFVLGDGAHTPSETSGLYTPTASATDRPCSPFFASLNVSAHDDPYVPTNTEQSNVRGVRIEADTLSSRRSNLASMLGDSHDAFLTGHDLRNESRVSTATCSRRRTLSAVSPTVSSVSFTTMPTIIALPAAPIPLPVESPLLTIISSLSTSILITPSASLYRNGSIRSLRTIESDRTYGSAELQPSPVFIPVDLPKQPEYEPSYSGLEGTMSEISAASPGYDVIHHYISTPYVASMDSRLIDALRLR